MGPPDKAAAGKLDLDVGCEVGRGRAREREGLKSKSTSGLWIIKDSPPEKRILFSFHGSMGTGRGQGIITNSHCVLWDIDLSLGFTVHVKH